MRLRLKLWALDHKIGFNEKDGWPLTKKERRAHALARNEARQQAHALHNEAMQHHMHIHQAHQQRRGLVIGTPQAALPENNVVWNGENHNAGNARTSDDSSLESGSISEESGVEEYYESTRDPDEVDYQLVLDGWKSAVLTVLALMFVVFILGLLRGLLS